MKDKVLEFIKKHKLIDEGDSIVVGLSGGPDSVCLLHLLYQMREQYKIKIFSAHVNHMIRGEEALRDEAYSREISERLGIQHFSIRIEVEEFAKKHKITCEEAGRYVRYNFFDEVSKKVGANKIALAHNMNDNAETILMNIIRGSGTTGLTGIPVMRENRYIRPILCLTRQEIEEYCALNNLQPKIDSTNKETIYTRNKIRLELIPYIKENFNSNIIENLNKLSQIIKDEEDFLELYVYDIIKKYYKNNRFNIDIFNYNHISIKRRILRKIIEDVYGSLNGIEHKHIDECIELIDKKETGKYLVLPHNIICKIEYQNFVVEMFKENTLEYEYKINIPGETYISEIDMHVKTKVLESLNNVKDKPFIKYFDYDKIGNDIVVRNRRQGDYIFLKGLSGKKKLKDVFIDNKVPREQRQTIPLVAKESEILWIVGMRDTAKYKIDETTKHILEIKIERGAKDDA